MQRNMGENDPVLSGHKHEWKKETNPQGASSCVLSPFWGEGDDDGNDDDADDDGAHKQVMGKSNGFGTREMSFLEQC